jgi:hypothetical protein
MMTNLVAGTIVIAITVLIHTSGLIGVTHAMAWLVARFRMHGRRSRILPRESVRFEWENISDIVFGTSSDREAAHCCDRGLANKERADLIAALFLPGPPI